MLEFNKQSAEGQEYSLGKELDYQGTKALVVRVVDQCALFEIPLKRYMVDELYVELLTEKGETVFISLKRETREMLRGADVTMRGPEPIMKMAEDHI